MWPPDTALKFHVSLFTHHVSCITFHVLSDPSGNRYLVPSRSESMSKKHVSGLAGVAIFGALAIALVVALSGPLTAGAETAMQAATAAPAATVTPAATGQFTPTIAISTTVSADPANDLTSATIDLHAGYIMDPYLLPVVGKSEIAASQMVTSCNGFVGTSPSVIVNWSGKIDQVNLFVYSDDDAVLAVQQPDGSTVCNDDAGAATVDPLVTIKNPAPGAYKVHVGTAKKDQPALGFLAVTQMSLDDAKLAALDMAPMLRRRERPQHQALPQLDPKTLLLSRAAIFGSTELQPGFKPIQAFVAGGGEIPAFNIEDKKLTCAGFVSAVPSYGFTWTGKAQGIRLILDALKDSTLAVVTPDQKVLCGMNADANNLNPVVDIPAAAAGDYKVFVAAMQPNTVVGGRLTITGDLKAAPAVLAPVGQ
jgi:hypothetical protein